MHLVHGETERGTGFLFLLEKKQGSSSEILRTQSQANLGMQGVKIFSMDAGWTRN
jgi:hypothetical protein